MVVHFKELEAHKLAVLSLYKTLMRHCSYLRTKKYIKNDIIYKIRYYFKDRKKVVSSYKVRDYLNEGYKWEKIIAEFYQSKDYKLLEPLLSEKRLVLNEDVVKQINKTKRKEKKINPRVIDLDNIQDLDIQREGSYVNKYIRNKRKEGLLPKIIDPIMLEEIIKPEALFQRAELDIKRADSKVAKGPYKVHVASSGPVKFVRTPYEQSPKLSKLIKTYVKEDQHITDMRQLREEMRVMEKMEKNWEKLTDQNTDGWGTLFDDYIKELTTKQRKFRKRVDSYSKGPLENLKGQRQQEANELHKRMDLRFRQLSNEAADVTPFEDLIGGPTLTELVHKYKFDLR